MIGWDQWLYQHAELAATKSKDSTQVGAVLVKNRVCRLTAFNGPPVRVHDTPERQERPEKYLFASHAEANLIAFAAREGIRTEGCDVYVTHHPCASCTRTLIQAGIFRIFYGPGTFKSMDDELRASKAMCSEAGIVCTAINPEQAS